MNDNHLKQFYHALNVVTLILMVLMIMYNWSQLPDRIPVHFDGSGNPNGWGDKNSLYVFVVTALGLTALMYGIIFMLPKLRKKPKWLNIPNKDNFLALPEDTQKIYWELFKEYLAGTAASMNLVFVFIIWGTIQVALDKVSSMPAWTLWALVILILGVNILYLPRLITLPKKLAARHRANPNQY